MLATSFISSLSRSVVRSVLALAIIANAIAAEKPPISIASFDADMEGWIYYGGWEFPGAVGSLQRGRSDTSGAAVLQADLTEGSYVAMRKDIDVHAGVFRFRVSAPNQKAFNVRIKDAGNQFFQYEVKSPAKGEWGVVELKIDGKGGHWGGANDGIIRQPVKELWLMIGCHQIVDRASIRTVNLMVDAIAAKP
jgi:hypothetical protein